MTEKSTSLRATLHTMRSFVYFVTLAVLFCAFGFALAASDEFEARRLQMVKQDIEGRGVKDRLVLQAMSKVPRHLFVDEAQRKQAYNDYPLPIGEGQTISQPYVVALMTEALRLKGGERVLELGTGSGYQAAVLAEIVKEVFTIEIRQGLYTMVRDRLEKLGYKNVQVKLGDGYFGWPEHAPFDAIIVTAAANHIPPPLIAQLKEGGRLIIPVGSTVFSQNLMLLTKEKGKQKLTELGGVRFVPLVGEAQKK